MSEERSLVPHEVTARLTSFGRLPFACGPRFFVALLLGLIWLVPAWWSPRLIAALFLWDLVAVIAFAADLLVLPGPSQIEVSRAWQRAPALATPSPVTVSARNYGRVGVRCLVVDETPSTFLNAPPLGEIIVRPGASAQFNYEILPRERGDARIGRLFVRYQTRYGFAERRTKADVLQTVRVLPDLEQARQHALYLIRSKQVEMERRRRRQRGHGREFDSLRDYRPGDDLRDVCWTATARRHKLTTRVFEVERSQVVWLVVDAGRLSRAEVVQKPSEVRLSKLDHAVNATLALAQVASQCGDRVGLLTYGSVIRHNVGVGRGATHLRTIVESLAQVRGEPSEADHSRAARVLLTEQRSRSLVVWITDFAETPALPEVIDYAMQIARRHLVVFCAMNQPDLTALARTTPKTSEEMYRHAAALEIVHRRDLMLRGLRQRGVFALELAPHVLASHLVNQYLEIKERSLL